MSFLDGAERVRGPGEEGGDGGGGGAVIALEQ